MRCRHRHIRLCRSLCCSVLQCVAMCCTVLQCIAVCCSVLQCVAEPSSMGHCDEGTDVSVSMQVVTYTKEHTSEPPPQRIHALALSLSRHESVQVVVFIYENARPGTLQTKEYTVSPSLFIHHMEYLSLGLL